MRDERVTKVEVLAAIRAGGTTDVRQVGAVVLETDGSFTVLGNTGDTEHSALASVKGYPVPE